MLKFNSKTFHICKEPFKNFLCMVGKTIEKFMVHPIIAKGISVCFVILTRWNPFNKVYNFVIELIGLN